MNTKDRYILIEQSPYVTGPEKTGLIYTKYTYSYYGAYLFSMYAIQILQVLLDFALKCYVAKMRYCILKTKI